MKRSGRPRNGQAAHTEAPSLDPAPLDPAPPDPAPPEAALDDLEPPADPTTWRPPARDEIRARTSDAANRRIDRTTRGALAEVAGSPDAIRRRLAELDEEWTIDRALMLNFSIAGALTASLAMRNLSSRGRLGGWGALFWTQMGFLAHHALRRWCPPMPLFRRLGFRSEQEIAAERATLQAQLAAARDADPT